MNNISTLRAVADSSPESDATRQADYLDIEVENLSKVFGRSRVLNDISFELEKGGFLSLFGPNGAGKTTLIKILSTIMAPTTGRVRIAGIPLEEDSLSVRKKIGLISHNPLLYMDLNAHENLKFYGALYGVDRLEERIDELLERVELGHRRYDLVRTFSKGMQQRLTIARALLHRPSILFLDEPHAGLDPHAVEIFEGLLEDIREDHTFIMITHNLEKGLELCSSVMILNSGRIILQQNKQELDVDRLRAIYRDNVKGDV